MSFLSLTPLPLLFLVAGVRSRRGFSPSFFCRRGVRVSLLLLSFSFPAK